MPTIGPTSHLLAAIRAQALAHRRQAGRPGGPADPERSGEDVAPTRADWMAEVARGVLAIGADDPERRRKAFRVYLQAVLVKDCAIEHADDPQFQALVDQVQVAMESDPRLSDAISTAGQALLQGVR